MAPRANKTTKKSPKVLALCGGIGGAKLALGLYRTLSPHELAIVVNTGDDFTHLGLEISPDIDTLAYTLAGLADPKRGWGRAGETWAVMDALADLGSDSWFALGDKDLATHMERTMRLARGQTLTHITGVFAAQWGIAAEILPMSDDPVKTMIHTDRGVLGFQDYFVRQKCRPKVRKLEFAGHGEAAPNAACMSALSDPRLEVIVICPSNPYLSIDPILALPGLKSALLASSAPVIAVSPIIGGKALKGPAAKIMKELGARCDALGVAAHYDGLLDGFVMDRLDRALAGEAGVPTTVTATVMNSLADRDNLARDILAFARDLGRKSHLQKAHLLEAGHVG